MSSIPTWQKVLVASGLSFAVTASLALFVLPGFLLRRAEQTYGSLGEELVRRVAELPAADLRPDSQPLPPLAIEATCLPTLRRAAAARRSADPRRSAQGARLLAAVLEPCVAELGSAEVRGEIAELVGGLPARSDVARGWTTRSLLLVFGELVSADLPPQARSLAEAEGLRWEARLHAGEQATRAQAWASWRRYTDHLDALAAALDSGLKERDAKVERVAQERLRPRNNVDGFLPWDSQDWIAADDALRLGDAAAVVLGAAAAAAGIEAQEARWPERSRLPIRPDPRSGAPLEVSPIGAALRIGFPRVLPVEQGVVLSPGVARGWQITIPPSGSAPKP